jgi:hypothetical protein
MTAPEPEAPESDRERKKRHAAKMLAHLAQQLHAAEAEIEAATR